MTQFRSRWGTYLTNVLIQGKIFRVRFAELRDGDSYYATSDKEVIEALKAHDGFGRDFVIFKEEEPKGEKILTQRIEIESKEDVAEDTVEAKSIVEDVTNISQAREYLISKGVIIQKLRTPKSIMKWANEMGIEFPNLKV